MQPQNQLLISCVINYILQFRLTDSGEVEMVFDQNDDDIVGDVTYQTPPPVTSSFQNTEPKQSVVPREHANALPSQTNNVSNGAVLESGYYLIFGPIVNAISSRIPWW